MIFLDDILVYSSPLEEHCKNMFALFYKHCMTNNFAQISQNVKLYCFYQILLNTVSRNVKLRLFYQLLNFFSKCKTLLLLPNPSKAFSGWNGCKWLCCRCWCYRDIVLLSWFMALCDEPQLMLIYTMMSWQVHNVSKRCARYIVYYTKII